LVFAAILAFSTSLAFAANPAAPPAADLDEVLHLLQQRRHGEVSFVEQRFLSLLKRPQESSGELVYDAPNRLEKRTLEPHPATLLLDGNVLKEERGHHSRVIDLNAYPQVLPFVESVRATLAGDRATLERLFRLELNLVVGPGQHPNSLCGGLIFLRHSIRRAELFVFETGAKLFQRERLPEPVQDPAREFPAQSQFRKLSREYFSYRGGRDLTRLG